MAKTGHKGNDLVLRLLLQLWIADDPALPNIRTLQFELRFDQRQNYSPWSYQVERVRQD